MKKRGWVLGLCFLVLIILLALAPNEKSMGFALRFILLHGAITWVSFVLFVAFGIVSLLYLLIGKPALFEYAAQTQKVATGFWLINFFLWVPLGYLEWNVVAWSGEPKAVAAVWVMLFLAIGYIAAQITKNTKLLAALYLAVSGAIYWRYAGVGQVLHPLDPVGSSNSMLIKGFFVGMLVVCLALAVVLCQPSIRKKS